MVHDGSRKLKKKFGVTNSRQSQYMIHLLWFPHCPSWRVIISRGMLLNVTLMFCSIKLCINSFFPVQTCILGGYRPLPVYKNCKIWNGDGLHVQLSLWTAWREERCLRSLWSIARLLCHAMPAQKWHSTSARWRNSQHGVDYGHTWQSQKRYYPALGPTFFSLVYLQTYCCS